MEKWPRNRSLLFGFLLFLCAIKSFGQQPQISFLKVGDEKTELHITHIEQGEKGYLWLGTDIGILKFDGIEYSLISLPDSLISNGNQVTCLFIHNRHLLAGFSNGFLADIAMDIPADPIITRISTSEITCMADGNDRSIYIGTNGDGMYYMDEKEIYHASIDYRLQDNVINAIQYFDGKIVVATDLGLTICQQNDSGKFSENYTVENGLTDNLILCMSKVSDHEVVMGMHNGTACRFDIDSRTASSITGLYSLSRYPIHHIKTPGNYKLLINTRDEVFMMKDENKIQHFNFQSIHTESKHPITDFIISNEGSLIAANNSGSLIQADFSLISIAEHDNVSFANVHAITCDENGNLWLANDQGIFEHAAEFSHDELIVKRLQSKQGEASIISLCDDLNQIWFGTFGDGLGVLNKHTNEVTRYTEKNGLVNNNVISIAVSGQDVWLATLGGASILHGNDGHPSFENFGVNSELGSSYVYCVFMDSKGRVWLGTDGKGLVLYDGGKFIFYHQLFPECGRSVVAISEDGYGNIWFYSTQAGMQRLEENRLVSVPIDHNNKKVEVFSITSTPAGEIALLTSSGLAVAKNDEVRFIHHNLKTNSNYIQALTHDANGRMWLATNQAIIRYEEFPFSVSDRPLTHIEGISLFLLPQDSSQHDYSYSQNHITFNYTSIWLQNPEIVTYQYRLDGYDLDWVNTKDRRVVYSKLPPGNYCFRIRSSYDGTWDNAIEKSYRFTINGPYWQKWWFVLSIFVGLGLIVWLVARLRWRNLQRKEALQRERIQSQFDTLRNQVNPHFLFNSFNTLITTIGKNQEEAIDYVENLSDYFRIVLQQREKEVITLHEELELVNHYLFLQQKRFGDNLVCKVIIADAIRDSIIPPLTLQLLVENAVKHNIISKLKPLMVTISVEDDFLVVSNNLQEKTNKEESTGVGLENIRNRYSILFKKDVYVEKSKHAFVVKLPIVLLG